MKEGPLGPASAAWSHFRDQPQLAAAAIFRFRRPGYRMIVTTGES